MCALVGLFHPHQPTPPDGGLLRRMADALSHRGPDGEGFHEEPGLGLGHRRLAIVDLAGGRQPMANAAGNIIVSFNGEIFNHEALRLELTALGHHFRTRSDTEAILHAWQQWGLGCLSRLNGQFAFALWDRARGQLVLARDHLGEKPLHYARLPGGGFAFASEPAALLLLPGLSHALDPTALDDYLALGYVPDPATIYAAIRRVPPAHYLLLDQDDGGSAAPRRYWSPPTGTGPRPADAPAELAERLKQAVEMRLMADVPLGCFLSGGVDSAGIAAIAAGLGHPLDSFTIGLDGNDEREAAAAVAAQLGGQHHAERHAADPLDEARRIAAIFGEPFGDSSAAPTLAVSALARRHVTVALSGDGGDEVFAGYRRYRFHQLAEGVRRWLPGRLRGPVLGNLARAYPKLDRAPRWLRARHTLTEMSLSSALGYYATVCRIAEERRRALLSPAMRAQLDGHDPAARFTSLMAECDPDEPLLQAQYADLHTYLPGDILAKVDRTSMAVSLEVRPPLLDHTLVAWGMALPARLKLRHGVGKHVLRQALAPLLPPELLGGRKQGFAAPLGAALRTAMPRLRGRLLGGAMLGSGLFDATALIRMMDEHAAGTLDHAQPLWQLLVLEGFLAGRQDRAALPPRAAQVA
jgi:asparagine synthase (glutamine-hydrolysing)